MCNKGGGGARCSGLSLHARLPDWCLTSDLCCSSTSETENIWRPSALASPPASEVSECGSEQIPAPDPGSQSLDPDQAATGRRRRSRSLDQCPPPSRALADPGAHTHTRTHLHPQRATCRKRRQLQAQSGPVLCTIYQTKLYFCSTFIHKMLRKMFYKLKLTHALKMS